MSGPISPSPFRERVGVRGLLTLQCGAGLLPSSSALHGSRNGGPDTPLELPNAIDVHPRLPATHLSVIQLDSRCEFQATDNDEV